MSNTSKPHFLKHLLLEDSLAQQAAVLDGVDAYLIGVIHLAGMTHWQCCLRQHCTARGVLYVCSPYLHRRIKRSSSSDVPPCYVMRQYLPLQGYALLNIQVPHLHRYLLYNAAFKFLSSKNLASALAKVPIKTMTPQKADTSVNPPYLLINTPDIGGPASAAKLVTAIPMPIYVPMYERLGQTWAMQGEYKENTPPELNPNSAAKTVIDTLSCVLGQLNIKIADIAVMAIIMLNGPILSAA